MQGNHILKMLEEKSANSLSEGELAIIEAHVIACSTCLQAYEAAQISDALIRARAAETATPSDFFKTRVMASIKDRHLSPELPALIRMWRAAGSLVSAMAMLVAILIGVTFYNPGADPQALRSELVANQNIYSLDYVEFEQADLVDDVAPYDQVLGTIYGSEDADGQ
jgi:predicted anti-sigma-YlaC factor YlaD